MKSFKLILVMLIGMIAFTNVSCSNDSEHKENSGIANKSTITTNNDGSVIYSFDYVDENGKDVTFIHKGTKENQTIALNELEFTQPLFQHETVSAGDSNTTCRILCATVHYDEMGVRSYHGWLIDDVTHQIMFYHYTPAQLTRDGMVIGRDFYQEYEPSGSGC
jgi:hypothetical protein